MSLHKCMYNYYFFYRTRDSSGGKSNMSDGAWSGRSPRTSEEGRLRWGDRGVATGRLWEPTAPNARLPQVTISHQSIKLWHT